MVIGAQSHGESRFTNPITLSQSVSAEVRDGRQLGSLNRGADGRPILDCHGISRLARMRPGEEEAAEQGVRLTRPTARVTGFRLPPEAAFGLRAT